MAHSKLFGPFLVLLGSLCFSTTGTMQILAPEEATPLVNTFVRMLLGSASLFLWCALTHKFPKNWKELPWKRLTICAFCLIGCQLLFFSSVQYIGVAVGTVVYIGVTPCAAAFWAYLFYKRIPGKSWFLSTPLAIFGVALLNGHIEFNFSELIFVVLPILAGFCYAAYITLSPKLLKFLQPEAGMAIIMAIVSGVLIPVVCFYPLDWLLTPMGAFVALELGIVTAGCAFSFFLAGLRHTDSTVASTLGLGEPLGAVCWGVFLLGEQLTALSMIGMVCVFLSILVLCFFETRH